MTLCHPGLQSGRATRGSISEHPSVDLALAPAPSPRPALAVEDVRHLLKVVEELHTASVLAEIPGNVLTGLRALIPYELAGCHLFENNERLVTACYEPDRPCAPANHKEFRRLAKLHPLNELLFAHPARAFKISDAISLEAFLASEFYNVLYRPLRVNRELVALLPDEQGRCFLLISLHRSDRDFTERERAILNALLPHIGRARSRLRARALAPRELDREGAEDSRWPDENAFHQWIRQSTSWPVTRRESDVLFWLAQGKTNSEIGSILGIAERTAETHALRLYPKIGVENRYSAIATISRIALG